MEEVERASEIVNKALDEETNQTNRAKTARGEASNPLKQELKEQQ